MQLLLIGLLLPLCAAAKPPNAAEGEQNAGPPVNTIRLRSAFDADPSTYLGRFVAKGEANVDESAAMPTLCSQHISYKMVPGGNVTYDELVEVNSQVSARFNIPLVARVGASTETSKTTRVRYTLTAKLQAEISDPEGFAQCCGDRPDQCTDRYVGEFLQGTGEVFRVVTTDSEASVDIQTPQAGGGASAALGHNWEQSIQFPEPVYFAFKLTETPFTRVGTTCGDWVDSPPQLAGGSSFVGVTNNPMGSEAAAKKKALADARGQAVKAGAGIPPETGLQKAGGIIGMGRSPLKAKLDQVTGMKIEAREWCVEQDKSGLFTARVLAFVADPR